MDSSQVLLAVLASTGLFSLAIEAVRTWRGRSRERLELEEAVSRAPLVRQSLELGNFDQAIKSLLAINTSQAAHIDGQDRDIRELRAQVHALEIENAELRQDNTQLERRIRELEGIIERRKAPRTPRKGPE